MAAVTPGGQTSEPSSAQSGTDPCSTRSVKPFLTLWDPQGLRHSGPLVDLLKLGHSRDSISQLPRMNLNCPLPHHFNNINLDLDW